jgi:hypothetical protein
MLLSIYDVYKNRYSGMFVPKVFATKYLSSTSTKEISTTDSEIASDTRPMNSDSRSLDRSLKRKTSLSSFAKLTILSNKKKAKESLHKKVKSHFPNKIFFRRFLNSLSKSPYIKGFAMLLSI